MACDSPFEVMSSSSSKGASKTATSVKQKGPQTTSEAQPLTSKNMPWKLGSPTFAERMVEQAIAMPTKPYAAPHGKK